MDSEIIKPRNHYFEMVFKMAYDYPYQEYPEFIMVILVCVTIGLIVELSLIFIFMMKKSQQKENKKPIRLLLVNFGLLDLAIILGLVPQFLRLTGNIDSLVFGIPLGLNTRIYWTNISYVLILLSSLCILLFNKELFAQHKLFSTSRRYIIGVYTIGVICFSIWSFYHGIFVFPSTISSLPTIPGIFFILLGIFPWFLLFLFSHNDIKRIPSEKSIFLQGFKLIKYSGLTMTASYMLYVLQGIFDEVLIYTTIDVVNFLFYLVAAFLLYIGFVMPDWYKNRLILKGYKSE